MNKKCIDLLNELKISIKKREEIEERIYTNKSIILKLADKIKEVYKDYINVISSEKLPLKYFEFKTNDEDIGFCGTLELEISVKKFRIHRIGFKPQHTISFCKDGIFIDDYFSCFKGALKTVSSVDEITKIIKTLNYTLENKQMIFESLEEYISKILNDKITTCSKEINTMENNLNFIESINL